MVKLDYNILKEGDTVYRRFFSLALALFIILSLILFASADSAVPTEVLNSMDSVVRVLAKFSDGYASGSGFVIKSNANTTLVVTNNHVVAGEPYAISIWMDGDETISAHILAASKQKDLCVLELAYPVASLIPLTLDKDGVEKGDAVYAVGYPTAADYLSDTEAHSSAEATITNGIISAIRQTTATEYGGEITLLQINAAINPGNSGGPLFDSYGNVVGINTYKAGDSEGIFGAIAVNELRTFLSDNGIPLNENHETKGNSLLFLIIGALLSLSVIVAAVIIVRRKTRNKQKRAKTVKLSPLTLRAFISNRNTPLCAEEAVSLLMPVAVELRKLHDNGETHLQISPDKVQIVDGISSLLSATEDEVNRYVSGYAAPEIYKGKSAGNLSDIYSFCALLEYATTGRNPQNALERITAPAVAPQFEAEEAATQAEGENALQAEAPATLMCDAAAQECITEDAKETLPEEFTAVIQKGMALAPENRFETIQTLIYRLTPFNAGITPSATSVESETGEDHPVSLKTPAKKKAGKIVLAAVLTAFVAIGAVAGIYFLRYTKAESLAESGSYREAEDTLLFAVITDWHDPEFNKYLAAGCLLEDRKYEDAQSAFAALGSYRNAEQMVQESQYRRAAQLADANEYDEALIIYNDLKNAGYKDSEDCWYNTRYRKAVYQLYELGESQEALDSFTCLSKEGYQKADSMISEAQYCLAWDYIESGDYINAYKQLLPLTENVDAVELLSIVKDHIYTSGQDAYRSGDYENAEILLMTINPYSDSEEYLSLIKIQKAGSFGIYLYKEDYVESLIKLIGFEDSAKILVQNIDFADIFLRGAWKTTDQRYYFTMSDDGHITYNLPFFEYGDFYSICNGKLVFRKYLSDSEEKEFEEIYNEFVSNGYDYYDASYIAYKELQCQKDLFFIQVVTKNCIEIYCYKDGSTFTLYRQ